MKEVKNEIESKILERIFENHDPEKNNTIYISEHIYVNGIDYYVEYSAFWDYETSDYLNQGYSSIDIDILTIINDFNKIIYEKEGLFNELKVINS